MKTYTRIESEVQASIFDGRNGADICKEAPEGIISEGNIDGLPILMINMKGGAQRCDIGDAVIFNKNGEVYPSSGDKFVGLFREKVEDTKQPVDLSKFQ